MNDESENELIEFDLQLKVDREKVVEEGFRPTGTDLDVFRTLGKIQLRATGKIE